MSWLRNSVNLLRSGSGAASSASAASAAAAATRSEDIFHAIAAGDAAAVRAICSNSHAANQVDEEGRTPLIVAAGDGNLEILRALLAEGADLFAEDKGGRTAYLTAAAEGHLSILQELALRNRNVIESVTKSGNNALHRAAAYGQTHLIRPLIAAGIPLNSQNAEGLTALARCSRWGHEDTVQVLVNAGADMTVKDTRGKRAIDWADEKGHNAVWNVLTLGPRPNAGGSGAGGRSGGAAGSSFDDEEDGGENSLEVFDEETAAVVSDMSELAELAELGTPIRVEGWMAKQGHWVRNWKNRWFVLDGRRMHYYAEEGAKKPKGCISMVDGTDVLVEEKYQKPFCFTIVTPRKRFVLQAADEDEMAEWIEAIQNNLECCQWSDEDGGAGAGEEED